MLLFVIGVPGCFTEWCAAVTKRFAERAIGVAELIEANSLNEIARGLIQHGAASAVVRSTNPNGPLLAMVAEAYHAPIVPIGNLWQAIADLIAGQGIPFPAALRRVATSCAAMANLLSVLGTDALVLGREQQSCDTALAIGRHLRIGLNESDLNVIAKEALSLGPIAQGIDIKNWWGALAADERAAIEGALGAYLHGVITEGAPIIWAPLPFSLGAGQEEPLRGAIDITGLPRCLLNGPDILLPSGRWSISVALQFSPAAIEHDYLVEISGCDPPQQHVIRSPESGQFEGTAEFTVSESGDVPLNIRLSSLRAAFDGTLTLVGAKLRRCEERPTTPELGDMPLEERALEISVGPIGQ